jgi:hypothetical protein
MMFRWGSFSMSTLAERVVRRFMMAFRYVPKEKKKSKVDRTQKFIQEHTGLSNSTALAIADALVRSGRDIESLAHMKDWPIEDGIIEGPKGRINLKKVRDQL